jgi:sec-independent protein translocase protein TatA
MIQWKPMFDIGPEKLLIILAVALLVVGPKRIPEIARSLGRSMHSLREGLSGSEDDEPGEAGPKPTETPGASAASARNGDAPGA